MSSNYPEGSMLGSGIYAEEVYYQGFFCKDPECGERNEEGEAVTDDWGRYEVECEFCGVVQYESSISEDRSAYHDY